MMSSAFSVCNGNIIYCLNRIITARGEMMTQIEYTNSYLIIRVQTCLSIFCLAFGGLYIALQFS